MNVLINITQENGVPVVSSREVAEHFGKEHKNVLQAIENIKAENSALTQNLVAENSATKSMYIEDIFENRGKTYPMYLMTRDGFTLLAMGFTGKEALAWKLKYIEAFNSMEHQLLQGQPPLAELSPELRLLINLEMQQKEQQKALAEVNQRMDDIREIVALSPTAWRDDARHLIVKIAQRMGGNEFIKDVQAEVHSLVDQRAGASLAIRLENKRRRMAQEGVCRSKRDKLTKVDIIAEDKKLIEIYLAVVKDMAVKYGVSLCNS